jgi:tricorn protease
MKRLLLIAVVAASIVTGLNAQTPPLLAQQHALGATQIVFVFGGDLWSVPRQGGDARRLTVGVGLESDPAFSPDGRLEALSRRSRHADLDLGPLDQPSRKAAAHQFQRLRADVD